MDKNINISVCIPTYECGGKGAFYLKNLLDSLEKQTYKNFDVVVSDHAKSDELAILCKEHSLPIQHHYNPNNRGSCEANLNNAIRLSSGDYIKPMLQDDYFYDIKSLESLVNGLVDSNRKWVSASTIHCTEDNQDYLHTPHIPWLPNIPQRWLEGDNGIGSPSLTLYPRNPEEYNPFLVWLMDVEYYYRLWIHFGYPVLVNDICIVTRQRSQSITNVEVSPQVVEEDRKYCLEIHIPRPLDGSTRIPDINHYPIMLERATRLNLL